MKLKRNSPCPCGSGKKYKKCCLPLKEVAWEKWFKEDLAVGQQRISESKDQP